MAAISIKAKSRKLRLAIGDGSIYVKKLTECTGNVAILGYCLGALMTFLAVVRYAVVDAAVAYHGADTEKYLSEIRRPPRAPANTPGRGGRADFQDCTSPDQGGAGK